MGKTIKLANRSRKNRIFFDHLIRELAISLNLGDDSLNRKQLVPTYVSHEYSGKDSDCGNYIQLNSKTGCLYVPLSDVLPASLLDSIDDMLRHAPLELKGSGSRKLITAYLSKCTDLNDCHYSALNSMQSIY